ncbi:MAG: NUDIX domain-containing protein [Minisyncoccia bacterium]
MEKNANGEEPRPRVGVGVMIQNEKGEVLLGLRAGAHGAGEWAFPGGHVEFGETVFQTAVREVKEETDLNVGECKLISVCDEMRYIKTDNKHYLNMGVLGIIASGEPKVMEPQKCKEWKWFPLDSLPKNLFESTERTLRNFNNGEIYRPEKS